MTALSKSEPQNLTPSQRRNRRIELAAWAIYLASFVSCRGFFAGQTALTVTLAVTALIALLFGRPLIRTIAVFAFLFPMLTLINEYRQGPRERSLPQSPRVLEDLRIIDEQQDGKAQKAASTPAPAAVNQTPTPTH
jgi:hypothetical protein